MKVCDVMKEDITVTQKTKIFFLYLITDRRVGEAILVGPSTDVPWQLY
jgi:hypothetical protein